MPNSHCKVKSSLLPVKGNTKYQRATNRVIKEGVASNILDSVPQEKIKGHFARSFNVTGFRPTLDRWKHKEADKLNFKDLIEKLKPSRVLCLDDLDPERSTRKHLIGTVRYCQKFYEKGGVKNEEISIGFNNPIRRRSGENSPNVSSDFREDWSTYS